MTTANKTSIYRILLVPVCIVQALCFVEGGHGHHRRFAIASISDGVDDRLARPGSQRRRARKTLSTSPAPPTSAPQTHA